MATAERLVEEGKYVYLGKGQGKSIVSAFRRYLETGDSAKITKALYDFLMMKCGFIAHYDIHGFRGVYRDPAALLAVFDRSPWDRPVEHSASVYTDGMFDQEVYRQMVETADERREQVVAASVASREADEVATAEALARKHGFRLVSE